MTETTETIGQKLSPILEEIEDALWDYEAQELGPPEFTDEGFRAACKIMMAALMDKIWLRQEKMGMPQDKREEMAQYYGADFHKLILLATDIDTTKLYD